MAWYERDRRTPQDGLVNAQLQELENALQDYSYRDAVLRETVTEEYGGIVIDEYPVGVLLEQAGSEQYDSADAVIDDITEQLVLYRALDAD